MPSRTQLYGKSAIVTGGSRGIGLAISAMLLDCDASVTISGTSESRLREARERLVGADVARAARLETARADVRVVADVERMVDGAVSRFGGLDILVNNAAVGAFREVAEQSPEEWRLIVDTNLTGVFHCCHAAIPYLRRRGGGWIINISSLAGKNAFSGGAAYCASKAGLNAFSEALMHEVRYDDIRVSCVMPGSVRTTFAGETERSGTEWKLAPEDVAQVVVDLLGHDTRSLPSRVEIRPSKPRK